MNLKHNVSNLPLEGIDASFEVKAETVEAELVKADAGELRLATPLTGDLRLEPSGGHKFLARGWIAAKLRVACSRCLAEFDYPVSEEVMEVFTKKPVDLDTEELKAEASDQEFFSGDDLDLWPIVLEHMVLGAPIKPLCRGRLPRDLPEMRAGFESWALRVRKEDRTSGSRGTRSIARYTSERIMVLIWLFPNIRYRKRKAARGGLITRPPCLR